MPLHIVARSAAFLRVLADALSPDVPAPRQKNDLGEDTLKRLEDHAAEAFKREVDLDESIWRSLPFLAATFAFVAAVVGRAATDVPTFSIGFYSIAARLLLVVAVLALAWSLRWFFVVLKPREYEYPAATPAVRSYAEQISNYHAALDLDGDELDSKVVEELRLFMVEQYGSAVGTNQRLNAVRFEARGKVLLFMLVGFVLAFLCEALIFVHKDLYGLGGVQSGKASEQRGYRLFRDGAGAEAGISIHPWGGRAPPFGKDGPVSPRSPLSAESAARNRGSERLGLSIKRQDSGEAVMAKGPVKATGSGSPPARPVPPPTQFVAKLDDSARVHRAPPVPAPKPSPKK